MTKAQKRLRELRERQSKERGKMAELSLVDELNDEQRAELDGIEAGTADLERQLRAAQVAVDTEEAEQRAAGAAARQPEGDAEDRERAELRRKVTLGGYVTAAVEMRSTDGAEAEYNAAIGLGARSFPLELLAPAVEERATTDADTTTVPRRWLDRLFADTAAERLGVTMESVPAGVASFPITTAGASGAQRAKEQAAADAAWEIDVSELKPTRNAVRLVFSIEDAARIPGLESALTRDLRMALVEGVDRTIFVGDDGATGAAADIVGLTTFAAAAGGLTEATISQTDKVLPAPVLAAFLGMVDGIHAGMVSDLRCVLTVGAHNLWGGTIANSAAENQTILAFLKENGLSCSVRGEIETATAAGDFGAFVGRARGIEGAAVAAVWSGAELLRDPYSDSGKGTVALTLSYLWNFAVPRPSSFSRVKFVSD